MNIRLLLVGICFFPMFAFAQTSEPDTLESTLEEITVVGFQGNRPLSETPGSIAFVSAEQISAFDQTSLVHAFNSVPGMRMEERAPGSYRIAIRGSALRSPFGVRNVKVYWNGIPFTEPTGSTFLNLLGTQHVRSTEVIRGPTGSVYGAGNGGTLLMDSFESDADWLAQTSVSTGSFGLQSLAGRYISRLDGGEIQYGYQNQQSDGFRDQAFLNRETVETHGRFTASRNSVVSFNLLYSNLNYGIPGGLTAEQFRENPQQARAGSERQNSSIRHESLHVGASIDYRFWNLINVESVLFGSFSDFENPFLFDYKRDSRKSGGIRTVGTLNTEVFDMPVSLRGGSEFQLGQTAARNFENNDGVSGALNFDDDLRTYSLLYFATADIDLSDRVFLTAGLSYNSLRYDIDRLVTFVEDDVPGNFQTDFDTQFVPRIGLAWKLDETHTLHASISQGFSPPTIEEVRTNEGSINLDLAAERGTSWEVGIRGNIPDNRFSYDLALFYYRLNDAIIQLETERGTDVFRNAGGTDQFGLELGTQFALWQDTEHWLTQVNLQNAFTFYYFRFDDYQTADADFSGNDLTGVPPLTSFTQLLFQTRSGIFGTVSHYYSDAIPLNDANTVSSDPFHVVKTKLGIRRVIRGVVGVEAFWTLDNVLNEDYSLGFDINPFGERYFQPAPQRNYTIGITLDLRIKTPS
ncbi:MAG: TonB-dependent receptor [Bacteroidota bacterium]